ncbi:CvpA family protein [Sulfurospirillum sp. T05]|uniref:CvpA family protein n=1 Tax=Sulfurospirillum tamanense TaxID=2813362 RepID=A0ABS2WPT7_9BACT|nr:CvpA family protein [Sulfurospirillum tamanensis]MBN2963648.1 CvpA family protein [Sulfurospirillum tamanensis]
MEHIVWFDIITISLILLLGFKGILNGFVKETFGLLGVVGGIFIASRYAQEAGAFIDASVYAFDNKASLFLVGFIALLLCFWILCLIVGKIVAKLLSLSALSGIDKIAGFFVGSAKIFLVFSIFIAAISNIDFVQKKIDAHMTQSFMYPIFMEVGQKIVELRPDDFIKESPSETLAPDAPNDTKDEG